MGQEVECKVEFGKESSQGKALLETDEVIFRGGFRLKILHSSITAVEASAGKLSITFEEGTAVFHLGDAAEKWAARIRNPPSRLDKLGVKPGTKVRLMGIHDYDFREELSGRGAVLSRSTPDLTFLSVNEKSGLEQLRAVSGGAVWVIYPKGVESVTENDVLSAGRGAGLVDVKVARFSTTHTALKFVPRK